MRRIDSVRGLLIFLDPRPAAAQDHVVPLAQLQKDLRASVDARANNTADLERVLALPAARKRSRKATSIRTR